MKKKYIFFQEGIKIGKKLSFHSFSLDVFIYMNSNSKTVLRKFKFYYIRKKLYIQSIKIFKNEKKTFYPAYIKEKKRRIW